MERQWWGLGNLICQKCETPLLFSDLYFSARGILRFIYFCADCKKSIHQDYAPSELQLMANDLDTEKARNSESVQHLLPVPVKTETRLSEEDCNWLREFHLDPEGGELQ